MPGMPGMPGATTELDPRAAGEFSSFLRTGINASMTVGSDPDGGYLAPPQIANEIVLIGAEQGAIRSLARGFRPESGDFRLPVSPTLAGAGRSSEESTRGETTGPKLAEFHPPSGGLFANVPLTNFLLNDATFNVEAFVRESIGTQFGVTESADFVSGDGVDKAFGFLSFPLAATPDATRPWGTIEKLHAGSTTAFDIDDVIDLVAKLAPRYRKRCSLVMHPDTESYVRKLKASTSGDYYWQPAVAAGMPNTLLGIPTFIDVNMPTIASAAGVIAVADWQKFYGVMDVGPTMMLRDPYTNKGSVLFYTERRTGGGIIDFNAGKILVMSV